MKKFFTRTLSLLCIFALLVSSLCVVSVSAYKPSDVIARNVQRQYDAKWKNYYIGGRSMYQTACGIFSIVNAVGYCTGNEMDVMEVGRWAYSIKAFNYSTGGTTRSMLYPYLEAKYGKKYGFTVDCNGGGGYWAGASSTKLKNHLAGKGVAIGHVLGHFICIVDYDPNTNKFRIFDSAPSSARSSNVYGEYGLGDVWVTQSYFSSAYKLTLDWFVLVTPTGDPINLDYGETATSNTAAEKIGTWQVNSNAPSTDKLNVRDSASTSGNVLGTVEEGDVVYTSELVGGSSNWGKIKNFATGVEGYASIMNHADYIGVDALGGTPAVAWGDVTATNDEYGRRTLTNNSATDTVGYDLYLPIALGTATTPYMSLQIVPNYGNGYYFGISEIASNYWMLRDCTSSSQLVVAEQAPYMTTTETLEIDLRDWWKPTGKQRIDTVRIYLAPGTSITINYFYFAATKGKVTDTTYNLIRQDTPTINENLIDPATIAIGDTSKTGSYVYDNGKLTVTADSSAGYEVVFNLNKDFKPTETPNWLFDLTSTTGFDVQLHATVSIGEWDFGLVSDFWPNLCDTLIDGYLPAETYTGVCDLLSCYTWNKILPENGISTIMQVKIILSGEGTLTLNKLQVANTTDFFSYADGVYKEDSSTAVVEPNLAGDLNYDEFVTTADARLVLLYLANAVTLNDTQVLAADFNGDGTIDAIDVRAMLLKVLQPDEV